MIEYIAPILRFSKKGEKTGWSYIQITATQAQQLKPGCKVSFRVKGMLDNYAFEGVSLLPMGDGNFILPVNGSIRKFLKKGPGDRIRVSLSLDKRAPEMSKNLLTCLKDDPDALEFFQSLPKSHQHYFSNWIESAKTPETKTKRIVMAVTGLGRKQGYGEMIRANKNNPS